MSKSQINNYNIQFRKTGYLKNNILYYRYMLLLLINYTLYLKI